MSQAKRVAVLGLGHIGSYIFSLLKQNNVPVSGFDLRSGCDLSDQATLDRIIDARTFNAVIAATPYNLNKAIATSCAKQKIAYFDLTEDPSIIAHIQGLNAQSPMVPQCGLAPGIVSVIAGAMAARFETALEIEIRVGALPLFPNNMMGYNLTWSTIGLINEYCNPVTLIRQGSVVRAEALTEQETLVIKGTQYEAALTSGGIGTLPITFEGKISNLNYKTIRYPGHFNYMRFLRNDLRMDVEPEIFESLFDAAVSRTAQDIVIMLIKVRGRETTDGPITELSFFRELISAGGATNIITAIQRTTAYGALAVFDVWYRHPELFPNGLVCQETLPVKEVAKSHFGELFFTHSV